MGYYYNLLNLKQKMTNYQIAEQYVTNRIN